MTNLERLLTIQANGDTSWLNGAHYVLNNFMPKWVRVEDDKPREQPHVGASDNVIVWYNNQWYEGYYDYDINEWCDLIGDVIHPTHWYIPQPPNE